MSYVVKAMCYLDDRGLGHPSLEHAKKHNDYELADAVARTSNGRIFEIIDQTDRKIVRTKIEPKKEQAPKKANQAWMRGG